MRVPPAYYLHVHVPHKNFKRPRHVACTAACVAFSGNDGACWSDHVEKINCKKNRKEKKMETNNRKKTNNNTKTWKKKNTK